MGERLFDQIVSGTGLPETLAQDEFTALLARYGKTPDQLTLEDLRLIVADFMQDVLVDVKENGIKPRTGVA